MLIFSTETPSDWNCFSSTAGGGRASAQAGGRGSAGRRYEAAAWRAACVSWWYLPNWGDSNKVHALLASSFCFDACCWRKLLLASLRFLCFLVGSRSQQNAQQALPAAPGASEIKMPSAAVRVWSNIQCTIHHTGTVSARIVSSTDTSFYPYDEDERIWCILIKNWIMFSTRDTFCGNFRIRWYCLYC